MIRIDCGETQDGTTVWLLIDSIREFDLFGDLLKQLGNGEVMSVDCGERSELFSLMEGVSSCVFTSVSPAKTRHVSITKDSRGLSINWKLSRKCWRAALPLIDGMTVASHQYFDYAEATVYISLMEGLRPVAD